MPKPERLLKLKDVAKYLTITTRTAYRLVRDGQLPAYKIGGSWRFKKREVEAWVQRFRNRRP